MSDTSLSTRPGRNLDYPLGETRPGWKVLRVLGNMLGLPGFEYETAGEVLADARGATDLAQPLVQGSLLSNKTGKAAWRHPYSGGGGGGLLTTAGRLVFSGDGSGNFVAFDATTGNPLWHARIGNISNAPETYMVDGRQHILVAAGDTLYSFALYQ